MSLMRIRFRLLPVCAAVLFNALVFVSVSQAQVTLSSRIVQGGLDLDFGRVEAGRVSVTRELELTMANSATGQYRLYQEVSGFLANERGVRLPDGAVIFQISGGSSGTSSTGAITPLIETPQELYISNPEGASDSVILAYTVSTNSAAWMAGTYRGNLRFTVDDRGSGARATAIVQVRLTVVSVARLEPSTEAPMEIRFGEVEPAKQSTVIELPFNIVNNSAASLALMQEVVDPLVGDQGQFFPPEALKFMLSSEQAAVSWQAVSERPERILSDDQGSFSGGRLSYAVTVPQDQRAGTYRGKLRIRLLSAQGVSAGDWLIPVELIVREVFTVSVEIINGSDTMHFHKDNGGDAEHVMRVTVNTNTGKPYQVLGGLDHPLVLPSGDALPADSLKWLIQEHQQGKPLVVDDSPVGIGLEPVFQSDSKGSSDSFLLRYRMEIPEDARDGVYSGRMHFSVTVL